MTRADWEAFVTRYGRPPVASDFTDEGLAALSAETKQLIASCRRLITPTARPPHFIVAGPPACKGSVVSFPDKRGVIRTKTDSKHGKAWAKNVAWCARTAGVQKIPKGEGVYICVAFEFAPPARRTRALPCVRPDIDKLQRALLDALTGIAYEDDGQVVDVHAWKAYGDTTQTKVWVNPA